MTADYSASTLSTYSMFYPMSSTVLREDKKSIYQDRTEGKAETGAENTWTEQDNGEQLQTSN